MPSVYCTKYLHPSLLNYGSQDIIKHFCICNLFKRMVILANLCYFYICLYFKKMLQELRPALHSSPIVRFCYSILFSLLIQSHSGSHPYRLSFNFLSDVFFCNTCTFLFVSSLVLPSQLSIASYKYNIMFLNNSLYSVSLFRVCSKFPYIRLHRDIHRFIFFPLDMKELNS